LRLKLSEENKKREAEDFDNPTELIEQVESSRKLSPLKAANTK
jgi:hypothetical protein